MSKDDAVLGAAEAAELLGKSPHTIRRWQREGRLKGRKVGKAGKDFRFSRIGVLDAEDPLNGEKACAFLGITRGTLANLRRKGQLSYEKGRGRAYRYSRRAILDWLEGEDQLQPVEQDEQGRVGNGPGGRPGGDL